MVHSWRGLTPRSSADPLRQAAWPALQARASSFRAGQAPCLRGRLSSNVRPHPKHTVAHPWALAVAVAAIILLVADVSLLALRWSASEPPPVAWGKLAWSVAIQCLVLSLLPLYLLWLARRPSHSPTDPGPIGILRTKLGPALALIVATVFSLDLLHSSLVCGGMPIPTSRGQAVGCGV